MQSLTYLQERILAVSEIFTSAEFIHHVTSLHERSLAKGNRFARTELPVGNVFTCSRLRDVSHTQSLTIMQHIFSGVI